MNPFKKSLLQLKFEYRSIVASEPRLALLYRPIIWWQQYKLWRYYRDVGGRPKECVVGPHAELVLDGFQGSGNSFAQAAFQRSQPRRVMVVHHMHSPAQIIKAVRLELPTLVTIRSPSDAVISLTSRWPYVSLRQALRSYVRFYGKIEPYRSGYVLSPFDQTTRHLGAVIRAVNGKFDTDFHPFEPTEDSMQVLRGIEELSSEEERERQAIKEQKAQALERADCRPLLIEARRLHDTLTSTGISC